MFVVGMNPLFPPSLWVRYSEEILAPYANVHRLFSVGSPPYLTPYVKVCPLIWPEYLYSCLFTQHLAIYLSAEQKAIIPLLAQCSG